MERLQLKVYGKLLTGHFVCDAKTAHEFLDWVDEGDVELWEPGQSVGEPLRWDTANQRTRIDEMVGRGVATVSLWFIGPPDHAVLLKLRWHD